MPGRDRFPGKQTRTRTLPPKQKKTIGQSAPKKEAGAGKKKGAPGRGNPPREPCLGGSRGRGGLRASAREDTSQNWAWAGSREEASRGGRGSKGEGGGNAITDRQRDIFEDMLRRLTQENSDIGDAMVHCLQHAHLAKDLVQILVEALTLKETPTATKTARLFLVSEAFFFALCIVAVVAVSQLCTNKLLGIRYFI